MKLNAVQTPTIVKLISKVPPVKYKSNKSFYVLKQILIAPRSMDCRSIKHRRFHRQYSCKFQIDHRDLGRVFQSNDSPVGLALSETMKIFCTLDDLRETTQDLRDSRRWTLQFHVEKTSIPAFKVGELATFSRRESSEYGGVVHRATFGSS